MKILRKINKGLVLTILVLLILFVYLFNLEMQRNALKPQIEETIKDYFELTDKYAIIPTELQEAIQQMVSSATNTGEVETRLTEYLGKFEEELKTKMIDNQTAIDIQKDLLEEYISENYLYTFTQYNTNIVKIKKYEFDGDQVTVTLDVETGVEYKYMSDEEEKTRKDSETLEDMTITLKLVDNEWKVVYSDIYYYSATRVTISYV